MRPASGFWAVAYALTVTFALSTVPTPLYGLYQQRSGIPTLVVTVIFAGYPLGILVALYLGGHVSDWLGRRTVLLPAIGLDVVAVAVFAVWPDVPGLLVARVLCGVAIGIAAPAAIAQMSELDAMVRGGGRAEVIATVANFGGLAIGALVSGLLAAVAPAPLRTPFLVFGILLVVAALVVAVAPETVSRAAPRPRYRPQRVSVPPANRPRYFATAGAGMVAFAVTGLFTSVAPAFLAATLHEDSLALAGLVSFAILGAGALVPAIAAGMPARRQVAAGQGLMALGLVVLVAVVWAPVLGVFVAGGVLAVAGAGVLIRGGIASIIEIAPPSVRGEALAGYLLAGYAALALPIVGLGLAADLVSLRVAVLGFTLCVLGITGSLHWILLRTIPRASGEPGAATRPG